MADNGTAASQPIIAWDEIGGVAYQRVKVTYGTDNAATDVSNTNPLPVAVKSFPAGSQSVTLTTPSGDPVFDAPFTEAVGGSPDTLNSTTTPLGAGATFTGQWVTDNNPQFGFNLVSSHAGTFYVEFSPDGGNTITLSKAYDVRAGEARFDVLIKFPGRSHRVRFVNGGTAQTSFKLLTVTSEGIYPFVQSDRDDPRFVPLLLTSSALGVQYFGLVDLSDRVNFPHSEVGRIDLTAVYLQADRDQNGSGSLRVGVVTRVNGTNADIAYVAGITFQKSDTRRIVRDRDFADAIQLGQSGGNLTRALASKELNVAAVNTGVSLAGPQGLSFTPAVGDLVVRAENTAGTFTASVSIQYTAKVSTT